MGVRKSKGIQEYPSNISIIGYWKSYTNFHSVADSSLTTTPAKMPLRYKIDQTRMLGTYLCRSGLPLTMDVLH